MYIRFWQMRFVSNSDHNNDKIWTFQMCDNNQTENVILKPKIVYLMYLQ